MEADQAGPTPLPEQQRRDVAVAHQGLGRGPEGLRVEGLHDPMTAVAAARAEDRVDLGIADVLHQLRRASLVRPRQVAVAIEDVIAHDGREAQALERLASTGEGRRLDRAGRRGNRESGPRPDRPGPSKRRHA